MSQFEQRAATGTAEMGALVKNLEQLCISMVDLRSQIEVAQLTYTSVAF